MVRRALVVAIVVACCLASLSAQSVDAAPTNASSFAAQVREFARTHGPGVAAASSDPSASVEFCLEEAYGDTAGDGFVIDATSYGIAYSCDDELWAVVANAPDSGAESLTDGVSLFIDRDHNEATGCFGDDVVVVGFFNDDEELVGVAVNTPSCNDASWTLRDDLVVAEFTDEDTIGLAFPHSVIRSTSFGWWIFWADTFDGFDAMPNTGWRTTLVPGTNAVQFRKIQFDSPGTDTRTNKSLNAEWVGIRNYGPTTKNLKGFSVRDAQNNVYTFKSNFNLGPDRSVKIHTGKGTNTATDRYWGRTSYVWNNGGDTATIENATKTTTDTCRWTIPGAGWKICPT